MSRQQSSSFLVERVAALFRRMAAAARRANDVGPQEFTGEKGWAMVQRTRRGWLVGLTIWATLVQGPVLSWAADGRGGGGGHFGGGHMGGGAHFGGGSHFGGGHIGGFSGSRDFSGPSHSFRAPTHSFNTPSFTMPSDSGFRSTRTLPSPSFQSPGFQNSQPRRDAVSIPQIQPNRTPTQNWSLPTHNGGADRLGGLKSPDGIRSNTPSFSQQPTRSTPLHGLDNGHNPYSPVKTPSFGGGDRAIGGNNLPGVRGTDRLGLTGGTNGLDRHTTLKPTIGSDNRLGQHPRIGGLKPDSAGNGLVNGGGDRRLGGGPQVAHNLPQFQSNLHGNRGDWGFGGGRDFGRIGGVGGGNWNSAWRFNCVNHHHHGWYGGAWGGYWGFGYYAPFWRWAGFWGLGSYYSPWGYGYSYYNPYCVTVVQPAYATVPVTYYEQPLSLPQQPVDETADAKNAAAYALVDGARTDFRNGNYPAALTKLDQAIPQLPNDTVVHELRGLTLFALGEYRPAAATLNALLAVAPGMNWATLRGLYPDTQTYEGQLRKLEDAIAANRTDPALRFVLAYLYMVTNYPDAAATQLKKVVELEPQDVVAKRLLESLTSSNEPPAPAAGTEASATTPDTDLVGRWKASSNGNTFDLTLNDSMQFDWQVNPAKGTPVKQSGRYTATADRLILEAAGQETLVARVQSLGADRFQFWANDKETLVFERQAATSTATPTPLPEPPLPEPPLPSLPAAPPPVPEASLPAPKTPVIGADGQPILVPPPAVDANKPENLGPVIP